jgi:hypothetical protein
MFVTFTADADVHEWEIDTTDVLESEAERIEREYRRQTKDRTATYDQWQMGVFSGESPARRVLLWHLMREQHPMLRIDDLPDFRRKALQCEYSRAELERMRDNMAEAPGVDDVQREQALAIIDREIKTARDASGESTGKA